MVEFTVTPVILSGGAGTRLWPLSTSDRPKQFLRLLGESLFESTLRRLEGVAGAGPPIIVAGVRQLPHVEQALNAAGVEPRLILLEPQGRNTAPAVLAAAMTIAPEDVMVVLPSDHLISDAAGFRSAVSVAVQLADQGHLVTFGIVPDRAETGYGYIQPGVGIEGGFHVSRFLEKPDRKTAEAISSDGRHLWNSGMFVFTAGAFLEEARKHAADVVAAVESSVTLAEGSPRELPPQFASSPSISIDRAVMERTGRAVVVPLDVGWSDVGSWRSVWEASEKDAEGNVLRGEVRSLDVFESYVHSTSRPVSVAGVSGLVVVETEDAVLIIGREHAQLVREIAVGAGDDGID
jgi:mannose-1-phosphate guanylyltransferase / mannose-6-phosphate isomerase